jgi:uncharacterized protein (DUF305 family)
MVEPAPYKQLDLKFATELYLYTGLALQLVRQPKTETLAPAIKQFDQGLLMVQTGNSQELAGWLSQWKRPLPNLSVPLKASAHDLSLSPNEVRQLNAMSGQSYTIGFLKLLISDEQGALQVASAEQEGGAYGPGRQLATEVIEGSTAAIVTLRSMLHQATSASR